MENFKKIDVEIKKYQVTCKECGKEIDGLSERQVISNLNLHIHFKHPKKEE